MSQTIEEFQAAIDRDEPLYLVTGDLVLAEPAAARLAERLAARAGCEPEIHRRPERLTHLLADLRTFSLFSPAKVVVVVESAVLADLEAAADLLDEALEGGLPAPGAEELGPGERRAASRLLQALHLFQVEAFAGNSGEVIAQLPQWAFQGGSRWRKSHGGRKRGRKQADELRERAVDLLEAARGADLRGWAESDLADLAEVVEGGLPRHHALVLAESRVARQHPLVKTLVERGAFAELAHVEAQRGGGWSGLDRLAQELERETGCAIANDALEELARRTIQRADRGRGRDEGAAAESTARLAAEYRKLANLAAGEAIDLELVQSVVEDRGGEDVWKVLDAIGEGRGDEALSRIRRLLAAASDPVSERLSLFALLAEFARQLTAAAGMMRLAGVQPGLRSYPRFKSSIAPKLQADLPAGGVNPLAKIHPYRLHRSYLAASRVQSGRLDRLPARLLEVELRLKGESDRPDAALAELVAELATAARGG